MEKNQKKKQVSSFVKANGELRSLSRSRHEAVPPNVRQHGGRKQSSVSSTGFHQARPRQPGDQRRGRQRTVTSSLASLELDCQLEDEWCQSGDDNSVFSSRRVRPAKKPTYTPANHLLNFHFEAPQVQRLSGWQGRRARVVSRTHRPEHVREQYLQARCKFVVRDDTDLSANLADPDALLDWRFVEQVWLMQEEGAAGSVTSCPICLCPPRATRITRCGHVFCWTCVLHYLALCDGPRRRCPICEHGSVQADQLLSCRLLPRRLISAGSTLALRLMRRPRDSLLMQPAQGAPGDHGGPVRLDLTQQRHQLTRFLLASPDQVEEYVLRADREDLQAQLAELAGEPEICFVEQALTLLDTAEQRLRRWRNKQQQQQDDAAQTNILPSKQQQQQQQDDAAQTNILPSKQQQQDDAAQTNILPSEQQQQQQQDDAAQTNILPSEQQQQDDAAQTNILPSKQQKQQQQDDAAETDIIPSKQQKQQQQDDAAETDIIPSKQQQQQQDDAAETDILLSKQQQHSACVVEGGVECSCAFSDTMQLEVGAATSTEHGYARGAEMTANSGHRDGVGVYYREELSDSPGVTTDAVDSETASAETSEALHLPTYADNDQKALTDTVELLVDGGISTPASDAAECDDKAFYFYQEESGQPIFLHALNAAMLLEEHGGVWRQCPSRLAATVLQVDTLTMDDALRHRLRALRHVPLTTEIQVVEVRLTPALVSANTLVKFKDQLRRREQQRRAKLRRQRQLEHSRETQHATAFQTEGIYWPSHQDSPPPTLDSFPTPPLSPCHAESSGATSNGSSVGAGLSFAQLVNRPVACGARATNSAGGPGEDDTTAPQFSASWSLDLEAALQRLDSAESATDGKNAGKSRKKGRRGRVVISSTHLF